MAGERKRRVIVESPYKADSEAERLANIEYAKRAIYDSLCRGEAPLASHVLYASTGILNDADAQDRACGMAAGWAWLDVADAMVLYLDRGFSSGMVDAIRNAPKGMKVEVRFIGPGDGHVQVLRARPQV